MIISLILSISLFFLSAEAFKSSEERDAEKYLNEFYDYDKSNENFKDALKEMQKMAGIDVNGELSDEVISHMDKARCGGKDHEKKNKRYNAANVKWDSGSTYRYYIHKDWLPRTMDFNAVRRAIWVALNYWERISNIAFAENPDTNYAKFSISFAGKDHLMYDVDNNFQARIDPSPLDNVPSGVLAHAYFPRNGNLHCDNAETWTEGTDNGINLRIVAAHEMGHAIGLHHSNDPKALMAPWYGGYISERDYKLPDDDTFGAQSIYGSRGKKTILRKKRDLGRIQSRLCNLTNFESVFKFSDDKVYIVAEENKLFRLKNTSVDESFEPIEINDNLKNADAIFYDKEHKQLIILKGPKVFSAYGTNIKNLTVKELKVAGQGAFLGKASAAFARNTLTGEKVQYFWVIQDNEVISGEVIDGKVFFGRRPRPLTEIIEMSNGAKLPPSIDAAYMDGEKWNVKLYLFVGNSFYIGKPQGRKQFQYFISADYPKSYKKLLKC